ncbi:MAG: thermonuclease family protein [Planctomycetia bacterium]|nr:thermonuclease family protein [Planctomycetia bacterium]
MAKNNSIDKMVKTILSSTPKKSSKNLNNGFVIALVLFLATYAILTKNGCVQDFLNLQQIEQKATETSDNAGRVIPETEVCRVDRCVDGDTIIVISNGQKERIRFIGSNTPETVKPNSPVEPFGPEASEYTKRRIAEFNNIVTLKRDGDTTDRYGRRLAMVYLGENGTILLNEELIQQGLAKAQTQFNYSEKMKSRFIEAENNAKKNRRNLWQQ